MPVGIRIALWPRRHTPSTRAAVTPAGDIEELVTIAHGQVSGSSSLTNFPMLYSVTDADLAAGAQSNGNDILFTASDGVTKLNHEIESYTSANGQLRAWVQIPTLSAHRQIPASTCITGNGSATNQQNTTGVWDSNYWGVYHLNGSTLNVSDSTGQHNGTNQGATSAAGIIGGAGSFDQSSAFIDLGTKLDGSNLTFEAWVNPSFQLESRRR